MVPNESRVATVHSSTIGAAQLLTTLPRPLKLQLRKVIELTSVLTVDLGALGISVALAYFARVFILPWLSGAFPPELPPNLPERLWWLPAVFLGAIVYEGLYTKRYSFWRECGLLIKAATLAFLVSLSIVTLAKTGGEVSRTLVVLIWFFSLVMLPAFRYTGKNLLARAGIWEKKVLVLGAGRTGELVMQALDREPYMGYRVVGLLDDDPEKKYRIFTVNGGARVKVLGGFRDSDNVMAETGVYNVIVAAPGLAGNVLVGLVNRLQRVCDSVIVVPDLFGLPVMGVEASYFFDDRFLALRLKNNLASRTNIFLKRAFDLTAGAVVLLLLLPVMAAIALAVKLDSPGPAVFAHRRIGRGGREFMCYKFRTMVVDAQEVLDKLLKENPVLCEEWERDFKLKDDPRITRVGRFLRKTSLDELPQIFNVIKGEMSLAGPRPIVRKEIEKYKENIKYFYQVRPGLTGLWQVSGRNEIEYDERVQLDAWYVRNWSLWLDITLLLRTVAVVTARKGAY
ncbi:undecaprenyl-phosphate galactose phosphotransferase WbaP [Pelotomaculum sp. PtaB.Bin117]|uniref:undecaprenyl-phosphate galactose phosphotransferase WbaP n=1 Tax=Pelotomaculum sp. PtaB.Bin117 TaxID=1811694 RepID=UPI0009C5DDFC|nr:undecaprenyl-phosphate galactose phosphotransferase WbaP [Pelotomaculum sp. PtaB.Bin117]OPX92329.1 MAG: UDP-glucose:undecaprenyl-phosphate glucose-1-phosphate transferase [Pelotomaculum sp. PtaB.Bin117]